MVNLLLITHSPLGVWDNTAEHIVKRYMLALPQECIQINGWQAGPAGPPLTPPCPAWRYSYRWKEKNLSRTVALSSVKYSLLVQENPLCHTRPPQHCHKWINQIKPLVFFFFQRLHWFSAFLGFCSNIQRHPKVFGSKLIIFFLIICLFSFLFSYFFLIRGLDNEVFFHQGISWPLFVETWGALCPLCNYSTIHERILCAARFFILAI